MFALFLDKEYIDFYLSVLIPLGISFLTEEVTFHYYIMCIHLNA